MRIEMKANAAGPQGVLELGKVYDIDEPRAKSMIEGGYAVALGNGDKARVSREQINEAPTKGAKQRRG